MIKIAKKVTTTHLIIALIIIIGIEVVYAFKFFTKEFMEYTIDKGDYVYILDSRVLEHPHFTEKKEKKETKIVKTIHYAIKEFINKEMDNINLFKEEIISNSVIAQSKANEDIKEKKNESSSKTNAHSNASSGYNVSSRNSNSGPSGVVSVPTYTPVPQEPVQPSVSYSQKIEIPKTGVNLQIYNSQTVSYMEKGCCIIYSSGALNNSGVTLILGHNYRNGRLFSNNNNLQVGDKFYITTTEGTRKEYVIYNKLNTSPNDVSFLGGSQSSVPEVVLSSCSDDEKTRIVLCAKAN